ERHAISSNRCRFGVASPEEERIGPREPNRVTPLFGFVGQHLSDALGPERRDRGMTRSALLHARENIWVNVGIEHNEVGILKHLGPTKREKPGITGPRAHERDLP